MRRWLTTIAFLVVAAMLANAQCSASCLVFEPPAATEHTSACCTAHCSLAGHSKTDSSHTHCQHKHSTLGYAELNSAEPDKASSLDFHGGNAVAGVGNVTTVFFGILPSSIFNRGKVPPERSGYPAFSVLRI